MDSVAYYWQIVVCTARRHGCGLDLLRRWTR